MPDALRSTPSATPAIPALRVPVRSRAAWTLGAVAALLALREAESIVVPLLLSILFAYALEPPIEYLVAWRLPRVAAAGT